MSFYDLSGKGCPKHCGVSPVDCPRRFKDNDIITKTAIVTRYGAMAKNCGVMDTPQACSEKIHNSDKTEQKRPHRQAPRTPRGENHERENYPAPSGGHVLRPQGRVKNR